ncbi:MAG: hypothetical protein Q6354_06290 [Candidatus Brocadiales bacterium]|nr:hypothetical protein [Candidatus Brocadiales bacterium]
MSIRVFISHSVAPWELPLVNGIAEEAARRGAVPLLPDRDWDSRNIPRRIKTQIEKANYLIGIATKDGLHIPWLNAEVMYGQSLKPSKALLLVVDSEVQVNPSYERVTIDRKDPLSTISQVSQRILELIQDKSTQDVIGGLVVGGLILLLLDSLRRD